MSGLGRSLINLSTEEQKNMLKNASNSQGRTSLEMGFGLSNQSRQQRQLEEKNDAYHDLDRLNTIVEKENEAHDFFGKGLADWQKNVTGKQPSKDATTLKKQFDDYEHSVLSTVPKGGKRHEALSKSLPDIKKGFLQQGHQFALDKLNERSRNVLDKGLQRLAKGALGASYDKGVQAHDDAAFDLINKYVLSEAKFDEKDADAMYDTYLSYAGVEMKTPESEEQAGEKGQDAAEKQVMKNDKLKEETEGEESKSSAQHAREMEMKVEAPPKDHVESARLIEKWEKESGNSAEDVEEHYKQKPGKNPTWMKDSLGKTEYYEQRAKDFEERNPGKKAPEYYREYGDKYVKRFDELKPELSEKGQKWQERAKDLLQYKMESGLRSGEWDESKPKDLEDKAYDSHSEAYLEAGLMDLPQEDIDKIIKTVDPKDMLRLNALIESMELQEK